MGGARWEVAAALLGSVAGELAGGGLVEVSAAPRRGALGLRLGLLVSAPRDEALGQGSASWTRLAVALGPRLRVEQGPWQLDLEGDLRGGPVFVSGQGYRDPRSETDFDLGLGGGVRLGRRFGAWAPFFDLGLAGWLRRQALRVQGLDETRDLPRIELTLAAGIQVSLEPDR